MLKYSTLYMVCFYGSVLLQDCYYNYEYSEIKYFKGSSMFSPIGKSEKRKSLLPKCTKFSLV